MGKKTKEVKTNAMRMAERKNLPYKVHAYDASKGFVGGIEAAQATGQDPERVFKTLVLVGHSGEHYVCVVPADHELDLKKAAKHFGEKSTEMIHVKEIEPLTGYIRGGCSPIGMKKLFRTAIHITAANFDTISVSGGKPGLQIELDPGDLKDMVKGDFCDLIKE